MKVEDISDELIFTQIPLKARLTKGIIQVNELAERQRAVTLD